MQKDRYEVDRERVECEEQERDLEREPRVAPFERFVRDECQDEDQEEWPTGRERAAPEIEDEKSRKDAAEEKLHHVHEPEVEFTRVCFRPRAAFVQGVAQKIDPNSANGDDREMSHDPDVVPENIDAAQGERVKDESADERYRGDWPLKAAIPIPRPGENGPFFIFR